MQIYIDNKLAAMKKGSSFDYVSENRLFSGSDDYSLNITFPLKDCTQNLAIFGHINRADVSLGKVVYDCEIRDRAFVKTGSVVITEVSDVEVKCQFLEGRSEQNYDRTLDNIYINELTLGQGPTFEMGQITPEEAWLPENTGWKCVALPWINNSSDSGLAHNFCFQFGPTLQKWMWSASDTEDVTWQPYLLYITKEIVKQSGYSYDFTEWEADVRFSRLIICNILPAAWELPDFSNVLPAWTVEEYLSYLEDFMGGEFVIDHRNKKITFKFYDTLLEELKENYIENVVDEHSGSVDYEGESCNYRDAKNIGYKSEDNEMWKYWTCDWFLKKNKEICLKYDTLKELVQDNINYSWVEKNANRAFSSRLMGNTHMSNILYAKDVDTYFLICVARRSWLPIYGTRYTYYMKLQPLNIFGNRIVNEKDEESVSEINFIPATIDWIPQVGEKFYPNWFKCIYVNVGSYNETEKETDPDSEDPDEDVNYETTLQQNAILKGKPENGGEYFDRIMLAYWDGYCLEENAMPYPEVEDIFISSDWSKVSVRPFNFRLTGDKSPHRIINKVNPEVKVTFKFIANTIPDVRAVFFIRGKRYVCEKITATFTENGMSQLLKGEFYPLDYSSGVK